MAQSHIDRNSINSVDITAGNGKITSVHFAKPGKHQTERQKKFETQAAVSRRLSISVSSYSSTPKMHMNRLNTVHGHGNARNAKNHVGISSTLSPISGSNQTNTDGSHSHIFDYNKMPVKLENSYRLFPKMGVPKENEIKQELNRIIQEELNGFSGKYQPMTARYYAKNLTENAKHSVKDFIDTRYKVLTCCQIGENNGQELRVKSGFLWNAETDCGIDVKYVDRRTGLFVILNVFFVYFD